MRRIRELIVATATVALLGGVTAGLSQANTGSATDLSLTKSAVGSAAAGSYITYTLQLENDGSYGANSVVVSDYTPANTTFVSATQTAGTPPGPTWTLTTPSVGGTGEVRWTSNSAFWTSHSATFQIVVKVDADTPLDTVICNTATVSYALSDTDPSDNTANAETTVTSADLAISKSGTDHAILNEKFTYTITVWNNGPGQANATVKDFLPAGLTFRSLSQTSGPTFACNTPPVGSTGTVSCKNPAFASGATAVFKLRVKSTSVLGPLTNHASVSHTGVDPIANNDNAWKTTTITH